MTHKSQHIIAITTFITILTSGWIFGNDTAEVAIDLLVSKLYSDSQFVCDSNDNKSILWKRKTGQMLYSLNKLNPRAHAVLMNDSSMPTFILTLFKTQLNDADNYLCEPEGTDAVIKQLIHIVVDSDPSGGVNYNDADDTIDAWCSWKYAGNLTPTVSWYSRINDILTDQNASFFHLSSSGIDKYFNSTVSVSELAIDSFMICNIEWALPHHVNASRFVFNWTSQAYSGRPSITSRDSEVYSISFDPSSIRTTPAPDSVRPKQSTSDSRTKSNTTIVAVNEKHTDVIRPAESASQPMSSLVIGMIVALVVIVVVLIVVIIGMFGYFRSKTAASRRRRAESSYAMPLPADLPRSNSYEQIEPIYNEPNANRASIMSSHSYNYPEKCLSENAPPLPERDMSNVGQNWKSAEKLYNSDENVKSLKDPGVYLRMPDGSKKGERSDKFGYTLVPGDESPNIIPMYELSKSLGENNECSYEKMKQDEYTCSEVDEEVNHENLHSVRRGPNTVEVISQKSKQDTKDGYQALAQSPGYQALAQNQDTGYQRPFPIVADPTRYFPLIKRDTEVVDSVLQEMIIKEVPQMKGSDQTSVTAVGNKAYLKLISDE